MQNGVINAVGAPIREPRRVHLKKIMTYVATMLLAITHAPVAQAQVNGEAYRPYLGWSSFSQQVLDGSFLTQANIVAQSDALFSSGLQQHGFTYINIDSGWQGSFDGNGRPIPNLSTFPDIRAMIDHIHANGQKAGIYWIPGIEQPAVDGNYPILGTSYHTRDIVVTPLQPGNAFAGASPNPFHDKIDFKKPGAQEYINSVVALFASWGVDFLKLDGVTPGSYSNNESIDNRDDVAAYSKAIAQSGRRMWLTLSWQLNQDYLSTWQQFSNARRIDDDVECEGRCGTLTNWPRILVREYDDVGWEHSAGSAAGWNDMDTLDVGSGATDGLSEEEKQSAITIWAMANSPLYLGGDLTKLDDFAKSALSNDELLAVDQSGNPGVQIVGGNQPVWMADAGDGSVYVALYNFNAFPSRITVRWSDLGFKNAAAVRDVWSRIDLGASIGSFSTTVLGHGSRILKVRRSGATDVPVTRSYEAENAIRSGDASVYGCTSCSGGSKVGYLGASLTGNSVSFNNVSVERAGVYRMQVDAMTQGPRALVFSVNGGTSTTLNMGGGSFNIPQSITVPVALRAGTNDITFYNPGTYASDLDRIVILGSGDSIPSDFTVYEGESAVMTGGASIGQCPLCSGGTKAGNLGGSSSITFNNVTVQQAGTYQVEVDYLTSGQRSFQMTVNNGSPISLDLNGSTFDSPASTVVSVPLQTGTNTIKFGSDSYAPDLDSITVGPVVVPSSLSGAVTKKSGSSNLRFWQLTLTNSSTSIATKARVNSFQVTPVGAPKGCKALVLLPFPLPVGSIGAHQSKAVPVPVAFTPACGSSSNFSLHTTFSADNGADVGTIASTAEQK
jgi:alpha-galactosidase